MVHSFHKREENEIFQERRKCVAERFFPNAASKIEDIDDMGFIGNYGLRFERPKVVGI